MSYIFVGPFRFHMYTDCWIASLLLFAGTDTTSNALTRLMDIMGRYPDVQKKLRGEVIEAQDKYGEHITYDELVSLPYLDAICRELLRL